MSQLNDIIPPWAHYDCFISYKADIYLSNAFLVKQCVINDKGFTNLSVQSSQLYSDLKHSAHVAPAAVSY